MEVPYNTTLVKEMRIHGQDVAPVADWKTKRGWVDYAFGEMEKAGYSVASAYAVVKDPSRTKFLYRDLLWTGADMIGLGVASFSHVGGTHFQNLHDFDPYIASLQAGKLPIFRALTPTAEERMIRELILQMKLGQVHRDYFETKFGVECRGALCSPLANLRERGLLASDHDGLTLIARRFAASGQAAARFLPARTSQPPDMPNYDAIVIGGGPAGSTAAAILAQKGRKVVLLEKEKFPRYHIGESLLPYGFFTLERLGVLDKIKKSHFVKKFSVQFVSEDGRSSQPFYFHTHLKHEAAQTWQVLRSELDQMLLDNAREKGAEVIEEITAREPIRETARSKG